MATFTQRSGVWFVQIRRKGYKSISRTFDRKADGEKWASQIEAQMGVRTYVDNRETLKLTLADCLARYLSEVTPDKKSAKREAQRIRKVMAEPFAARPIGTIKQTEVAAWRDSMLAGGLTGSAVNRYLALLSHLFTIAAKEWQMPLQNPVAMIRKPRENSARDRRLRGSEEADILAAADPESRAFFTLSIETAMRRSEIASLRRDWVRGLVAYLPDTKNGEPRAVPLSSRALAALAEIPARIDGRLFEYAPEYYTRRFGAICKQIGISGLRLHDLRHEATSRLFEKELDVMEVSSITGHKSLSMLKRYTHLNAEKLAKKLG